MQDHERKGLKAANEIAPGFESKGYTKGHNKLVLAHPLLGAISIACSPGKGNTINHVRQDVRRLVREQEGHVTGFLAHLCEIFEVGQWESKQIPMNLGRSVDDYIARNPSARAVGADRLIRSVRASSRLQVLQAAPGRGKRDSIWLLHGKYALVEKPEEPVESQPTPEPEPDPVPEVPEVADDPAAADTNGHKPATSADLIHHLREMLVPEAEARVVEASEQMSLAESELREAVAAINGLAAILDQANKDLGTLTETVKGVVDLLSSAAPN